jgi:hypothetical protein
MVEEGKKSILIYITSVSTFENLNSEFMWMLETRLSIITGSGEDAKFFEKVFSFFLYLLFIIYYLLFIFYFIEKASCAIF